MNTEKNASATEGCARPMGSETDQCIRCDGCGDRWEKSFICARCSERETYNGEDDGTGWFEHKDICGNCCSCHLRGTSFIASDDPDDIPF